MRCEIFNLPFWPAMRMAVLLLGAVSLATGAGATVVAQDSEPPVADKAKADPELSVTDFESLVSLAESRVNEPPLPEPALAPPWSELTYQQFISIAFDHDQAIWLDKSRKDNGSPFWLETFHRGYVQETKVKLYAVTGKDVQPIPFDPEKFDYSSAGDVAKPDASLGHAGFKVAGPFPGFDDPQEMLSFLGGSYFRSRARDNVYGASARGLAVDIALNKDEEFPAFRTFWIHKPELEDTTMRVLAWLNGPSVSGAYEFVLTPGVKDSKIDVRCKVFFRKDPEKVGVAPLTSMWIWGDGLAGPPKEKRPAVHDSDGLLIHSEVEGWIWHPFARQAYPSVSFRPVETLLGFGVLQRNRAFFHFDDHNALYNLRPSIWVEPKTPWKNGRVELLEIPGSHEGIDNIGAYWVFNEPPSTSSPLELAYSIDFFSGNVEDHKRLGHATDLTIERAKDKSIKMSVRFSGEAIKEIGPERSLWLNARLRDGRLISTSTKRTKTGDWLAYLHFLPTGAGPVDVEMQLLGEQGRLSEIVNYLCPPTQPEFVYPSVYTREE